MTCLCSLEALGRLTTPAELLLSAAVVSGILSSSARQNQTTLRSTATKKTALQTVYIITRT